MWHKRNLMIWGIKVIVGSFPVLVIARCSTRPSFSTSLSKFSYSILSISHSSNIYRMSNDTVDTRICCVKQNKYGSSYEIHNHTKRILIIHFDNYNKKIKLEVQAVRREYNWEWAPGWTGRWGKIVFLMEVSVKLRPEGWNVRLKMERSYFSRQRQWYVWRS